jgi:hypothetical protein
MFSTQQGQFWPCSNGSWDMATSIFEVSVGLDSKLFKGFEQISDFVHPLILLVMAYVPRLIVDLAVK